MYQLASLETQSLETLVWSSFCFYSNLKKTKKGAIAGSFNQYLLMEIVNNNISNNIGGNTISLPALDSGYAHILGNIIDNNNWYFKINKSTSKKLFFSPQSKCF